MAIRYEIRAWRSFLNGRRTWLVYRGSNSIPESEHNSRPEAVAAVKRYQAEDNAKSSLLEELRK